MEAVRSQSTEENLDLYERLPIAPTRLSEGADQSDTTNEAPDHVTSRQPLAVLIEGPILTEEELSLDPNNPAESSVFRLSADTNLNADDTSTAPSPSESALNNNVQEDNVENANTTNENPAVDNIAPTDLDMEEPLGYPALSEPEPENNIDADLAAGVNTFNLSSSDSDTRDDTPPPYPDMSTIANLSLPPRPETSIQDEPPMASIVDCDNSSYTSAYAIAEPVMAGPDPLIGEVPAHVVSIETSGLTDGLEAYTIQTNNAAGPTSTAASDSTNAAPTQPQSQTPPQQQQQQQQQQQRQSSIVGSLATALFGAAPPPMSEHERRIVETGGRPVRSRVLHHTSVTRTSDGAYLASVRVPRSGQRDGPSASTMNLGRYASEDQARAACQGSAPPVWERKSSTSRCVVCGTGFGLLSRKHHCRNCGYICCAKCSSKNFPSACLPRFYHDSEKQVRFCHSCADIHDSFRSALLRGDADAAIIAVSTKNVNLYSPFAKLPGAASSSPGSTSGSSTSSSQDGREIADYPVHCAAAGGRLTVLKWLVEQQHCALWAKLKANETATTAPAANRQPLVTAGNCSVMDCAAAGGHVHIIQWLVRQRGFKVRHIFGPKQVVGDLLAGVLNMLPEGTELSPQEFAAARESEHGRANAGGGTGGGGGSNGNQRRNNANNTSRSTSGSGSGSGISGSNTARGRANSSVGSSGSGSGSSSGSGNRYSSPQLVHTRESGGGGGSGGTTGSGRRMSTGTVGEGDYHRYASPPVAPHHAYVVT